MLDLARADLEYYDHIIQISRDRFRAGDIAQIDLDRIELQRVQYESELQTALVNLRTAKIQLLEMLDDRTPVEQFDVTGTFDFSSELKPLDEFRQMATDARPDLRAAIETIQQSETNHKLAEANGSTDPTLSGWYTFNASTNTPIPPGNPFYDANIPIARADPEAARKMLADAGYPNGLSVGIWTPARQPVRERIAVTFRDQAKKAGVTVEVHEVPEDQYDPGKYQMATGSFRLRAYRAASRPMGPAPSMASRGNAALLMPGYPRCLRCVVSA